MIRIGWSSDSYGEGTNGANSIYPIPNAAWPVITCELSGARDCRQLAVGATGILSDNSGLRSKLSAQIPRWSAHAPFDLIVITHGFNDYSSTPSAITAELLSDLQLVRATYKDTPIVVFGSQAGSRGPDAQTIGVENAIAAAVTAFADPLCKFAPVSTDTTTWFNGTGKSGTTNGSGNSDVYIDPDGIHPTIAGAEYDAFRARLAIKIALTSMLR